MSVACVRERCSEHAMDNWDTPLTFVITPKSGPLRKMVRLRDAQQALIADLPPGFLRRAQWLKAGKALVTAADTGDAEDINWAFEAIVAAVAEEGWFTRTMTNPHKRNDQAGKFAA